MAKQDTIEIRGGNNCCVSCSHCWIGTWGWLFAFVGGFYLMVAICSCAGASWTANFGSAGPTTGTTCIWWFWLLIAFVYWCGAMSWGISWIVVAWHRWRDVRTMSWVVYFLTLSIASFAVIWQAVQWFIQVCGWIYSKSATTQQTVVGSDGKYRTVTQVQSGSGSTMLSGAIYYLVYIMICIGLYLSLFVLAGVAMVRGRKQKFEPDPADDYGPTT